MPPTSSHACRPCNITRQELCPGILNCAIELPVCCLPSAVCPAAVDEAPPLKILLVGQETLRATLKQSQHQALLNRIHVHYRVKPLTKEQTGRYIDVQMTQAGGPEDVFDHSVKELIHDFTGGLPRAINHLSTACLLQATARNVHQINEALFQEACSEFQLG